MNTAGLSAMVILAAEGEGFDISKIFDQIIGVLATKGLDIVAAILIFFIGRYVARLVTDISIKSMEKSKVDPTVISFAKNLIYLAAMAFVIIAALSKLGVESNSMIAVIGAAGLAVGLALQGALSNFAAGVLLIVFRPFKVGDLIEAGGSLGVVNGIELFTTTITTPDNKTVILPNATVTSGKITNLTATDNLRIDMVFGAGYDDNIDEIKEICMKALTEDPDVLKDPAPFVGVVEHGESSVNFAVRPFVNAAHYWDVHFRVHERIKKDFDARGISIPFPQRDVHVRYTDAPEDKS